VISSPSKYSLYLVVVVNNIDAVKKTRIPHRLNIIKYELNIIGRVKLHLNIKRTKQGKPT
jgi:hypothetical protein